MKVGGYDRVLLFQGVGIQVVQITWPPGTRTPKHDHNVRGIVYVQQGRIFEIRDGDKLYYGPDDVLIEIPVGGTHIVGNDRDEVAVTTHVFFGRLEMNLFEDDALDIRALSD